MRYWRRNPPPTDPDGNPLSEKQVKEILKLVSEIEAGWHTYDWFMDLLRMPGSDKQVVRYILANVDFIGPRKARVHPHVEKLEEYLEKLDAERYPNIELDLDVLEDLVNDASPTPYIQELRNKLALALENLRLATRLDESRESVHRLKTRIEQLALKIGHEMDSLSVLEEAEAEALSEEPVGASATDFDDCNVCGEEAFEYLKPDERVDVTSISAVGEIAELQHQLRHLIIELHDAMQNHRPQTYIFSLEDDIEDTHAAIERARSKHGVSRYRRNPAPLSDILPTPEEEEEIKMAIFNALYHSGAYELKKDVFIDSLIDQLSKLPYVSDHHLQEIRKQSVALAHEAVSDIELADALYEGSLVVYEALMGIGHKPMKMKYKEEGGYIVGDLEDDDFGDDDVPDADYFFPE